MPADALLLLWLVLSVVFIVVATARWRVHPFLVLLVAAYGLGLASGLSPLDTVGAITSGFGGTLGYIGIVIVAGTVIGLILERSGAALVMAETVVGLVGRARSALAMSVTGAVVSIAVFCDSGYVVLSPLNRSLAVRTGASMGTFAVALSMGLYATHVLVPPTPGPIAAAGELGADVGTVMLLGLLVTIPVLATSLLFAEAMGRRHFIDPRGAAEPGGEPGGEQEAPADAPRAAMPARRAFAPVLVPMGLIAAQSVAALPGRPVGEGILYETLRFVGDPNTALLLGVALAIAAFREHGARVYGAWVGDALREAGPILLITGAGGALGAVLRATPVGDVLGATLAALDLGLFSIFLPFLVAAALKSTLGSSTVAIITTASLMVPLLGPLGLAGGVGPALVTLAVGAGSMVVSHANDSYFWVVSQFSGMSVAEAYRFQTLGSAVAGVTAAVAVFVLRLVLV